MSEIKPDKLIIAHRGTTYYAPEETEAAMRWARNVGADYLEFDLQRTKDGCLLALHDDNLLRTTNIAAIFPERKHLPVSGFLYEEILRLDAGTWFNLANPDRARDSFRGLDILSLEDVIHIAEGYRIKRDATGKRITRTDANNKIRTEYEPDPADNGNRPGIYVETKIPHLFPGIEKDLLKELSEIGWYAENPESLKVLRTLSGKIAVGNSENRLILQTFSKESLVQLNTLFHKRIPKCFLLWRGETAEDITDDKLTTFEAWVKYGKQNGATIIGPSIGGEPNNYPDLLTPAHAEIIKKEQLKIHAYSFDTAEQMEKYAAMADGLFTNRADESLNWLQKKSDETPEKYDILKHLGY